MIHDAAGDSHNLTQQRIGASRELFHRWSLTTGQSVSGAWSNQAKWKTRIMLWYPTIPRQSARQVFVPAATITIRHGSPSDDDNGAQT